LLNANVIGEVKYSEWLANVVLVPKKNGKMRMCIDFIDLNKACKKDPFPLPRIDASVDKATRCQRFSLLDCFSGYHQIWMKKKDEDKTKDVLGSQLDRNIIAYIDDIVVMSKNKDDHVSDL